jgi:hypothetical protein
VRELKIEKIKQIPEVKVKNETTKKQANWLEEWWPRKSLTRLKLRTSSQNPKCE